MKRINSPLTSFAAAQRVKISHKGGVESKHRRLLMPISLSTSNIKVECNKNLINCTVHHYSVSFVDRQTHTAVVVWHSGSALVSINKVNLRAWLVLGWVTMSGFHSRVPCNANSHSNNCSQECAYDCAWLQYSKSSKYRPITTVMIVVRLFHNECSLSAWRKKCPSLRWQKAFRWRWFGI